MKNNKRGFGLVELMVVVAIIAILAGITISGINEWRNSRDRQRQEKEEFRRMFDLAWPANEEYLAQCRLPVIEVVMWYSNQVVAARLEYEQYCNAHKEPASNAVVSVEQRTPASQAKAFTDRIDAERARKFDLSAWKQPVDDLEKKYERAREFVYLLGFKEEARALGYKETNRSGDGSFGP